MNILVVDDEPIIRNGIKRTVRDLPVCDHVFLAESPKEAFAVLRDERIDVVLTDILMPGMTGLELMNMSRKRYPRIKWVVISAHSEFGYAQEAVRLGAKDYLLKPIGKEKLTELIHSLAEELDQESEMTKEMQVWKHNVKYLREALFQRWISGLDTGNMDVQTFMEPYPEFFLIMVKMDSDRQVNLEHFIIENVMSEIIALHGTGFTTSYERLCVLGLVMLNEPAKQNEVIDLLKTHLKKYLKVPFQVCISAKITDYRTVPEEVQRMLDESVTQIYNHSVPGSEKAVEMAQQYIRMHFSDDLSLEKVASVVFLNPVYFSQLFKQKNGQGFKEYVIQLRLEQAKVLLANPQLKLADVAERIGYQDMRYFTQIFRKRYEMTPTEYRQSIGMDLRTRNQTKS
ncbi:response regulator transcription factor [Gorillibacterium massiliense]|uniref:response regulator transcription factor n=1 Tax=Gorillibacterium massiliense TaxID=1280390 RepID=UPI0004B5FBA2|nr:response regulator [Gorillibacterium massiliense]